MAESKWYQKQNVPLSVLRALGVDEALFLIVGNTIVGDDVETVAILLGTEAGILKNILYHECKRPRGIVLSKELN